MIRKQNLSCLDRHNWDVISVFFSVNVGESQIMQSLKARDLGVTFDQFLNFDDHIIAYIVRDLCYFRYYADPFVLTSTEIVQIIEYLCTI